MLKYTVQTWQNNFYQNLSWWIFIPHTISTRLHWKKNGFEHIFILEFSPTSKNVPNKFFLLMGAKCMGYNFFFQRCTGWLLLSIVISVKSSLQISFLEIVFFKNFISSPPNWSTRPGKNPPARLRGDSGSTEVMATRLAMNIHPQKPLEPRRAGMIARWIILSGNC
jgi:hypothetical protein